MHVGLPHFKGQAFVEGIAKQKAMDKSGLDPRNADNAAAPCSGDALAQGFAATGFKF